MTLPSASTAWPIARDMILFFAGLVLLGNEAVVREEPRMALVIFYGGMMGIPAFTDTPAKLGALLKKGS